VGLSENNSISLVCKRTRARGPRHLQPKTILRQLAQAAAARPRHDDPKSQAGENLRHKVDQARAWRPRDAAGRASPACSGMPAQMGPGRAGSIGRWHPGALALWSRRERRQLELPPGRGPGVGGLAEAGARAGRPSRRFSGQPPLAWAGAAAQGAARCQLPSHRAARRALHNVRVRWCQQASMMRPCQCTPS
jgi:hypothetical protein